MADHPKFAMVSLGLDDSAEAARRHVERYGLSWPHVCLGMNSEVARDYGVETVPVFLFVGPDGKVIASGEAAVKAILAELEGG